MKIVELNEQTKAEVREKFLNRSPKQFGEQEAVVKQIIADVAARGDEALFSYTEKFDGATLSASNIQVTEEEIKEAYSEVSPEVLSYQKAC